MNWSVFVRYIQNPLLLGGKKFDVRSYLLIACTAPFMVFFRHGYARLTCNMYDPRSSDLSTHLTNQVQLKTVRQEPDSTDMGKKTVISQN